MEEKWTIDELETVYLFEYSEDDTGDTGDEVQNFLNWCKDNLLHLS